MYPERVMIVLFIGICSGMLIELILVCIINIMEAWYESSNFYHDHDNGNHNNVNSGGCDK